MDRFPHETPAFRGNSVQWSGRASPIHTPGSLPHAVTSAPSTENKCGKCSKPVDLEDTKDMVQCILCAAVYHVKCSLLKDIKGPGMSAKKKTYNCEPCKQVLAILLF
ncbi:hypothetical protein J6590_036678 [Homalodisca vitripennis]|nr:hypothetical protein J6590_036678 [Homalodisca vitripennis]